MFKNEEELTQSIVEFENNLSLISSLKQDIVAIKQVLDTYAKNVREADEIINNLKEKTKQIDSVLKESINKTNTEIENNVGEMNGRILHKVELIRQQAVGNVEKWTSDAEQQIQKKWSELNNKLNLELNYNLAKISQQYAQEYSDLLSYLNEMTSSLAKESQQALSKMHELCSRVEKENAQIVRYNEELKNHISTSVIDRVGENIKRQHKAIKIISIASMIASTLLFIGAMILNFIK